MVEKSDGRQVAAGALVALITGGSRGIGAATALALAARGYEVAVTYRNKARRAEAVVASAQRHGVRALALGGDLTKLEDLRQMIAELHRWSPRLDVVVLNASGGLERDLLAADPSYPLRINRDAQLAVVEHTVPLMQPGGVIVYVTSHWAHCYGQVVQLPGYEPVAASKYAGECALRARQADLAARGLRLLIVSGDLVEGTITPKLLERYAPGLAGQRQTAVGRLPTPAAMGEAIAGAALDITMPSGQTVVVGGALESLRRS